MMATQEQTPAHRLQRASLDGLALEYEVTGLADGEPVLLIHAGVLARAGSPR